MRRIVAGVSVLVLVLVVVGVAAFVMARPTFEAISSVDPDVTIRCEASAKSPAECRSFGDAVLAGGAPSTTFEMEDLARLDIARPPFALAAVCEVSWYLQRYPDDPVWTDEVECLGG